MRFTQKRFISILLAVAMLAFMITPVKAQSASDITGHWAEEQLERWIGNGIIAGYGDGTVRPNNSITRAEFVSILGRVFKFAESSENPFLDVNENAWYAKDVLSAAASGIISGDGKGYFSPDEPISRQQAAVVLAKAFCLKAKDENSVDSFKDSHKIASWSKNAISALVENGYMAGKAGKIIAPEDRLTRAEFIVLLDRIAGELVYNEGEYSGTIKGNLSVNCANVTLKDMVIKGDLFLLEGIGEGEITLDNVTVEGRTVVKGGGEESIIINNSSLIGTLLVVKQNGKVRIVAKGDTFIPESQLMSGAVLEEDNVTGKGFHNIEILQAIEPGSSIILDGDFEQVSIDAPLVNISIISGTVGDLIIEQSAKNPNIEIKEGAAVHTFTADAGATVTGNGNIKTARINANGVTIGKRPGNIVLADGVEANIEGSVIKGGTSGSSGSGSTGGTTKIQAPSNFKVSLSSFNTAQLYWTAVEKADGYNIYRSESQDGQYIKINSSPVKSTKYQDTELAADKTYYYKITAVDSGRESDKTPAKSVRTPKEVQEGQWKLVWSDEFAGIPGTGVDTDKWVYEVAGHGFGNNELQYTTDRTENVYIMDDPNDPDNGFLVIQALKEKYNGKYYTSGRIKTEGKLDFTYGKVEMRAKLPLGKGIGSSFWMLGSNYSDAGWPSCGEIDIMENVGQYPDRIFGTIHGPGYSAGDSIGAWHEYSEGFTDEFHTYAVEWEPGIIRWYFDDFMYCQRTTEDLFGKDWVFDHDFFIILGLGVGGTWPGNPDDTTIFPQKYIIDYVRVYQREANIYPEYARKNLVQIKAGNGKYVCADEYNDDYLYANRDSAAFWETFELVDLGNNNVALIGINNYKYISVEPETFNLIAAKETVTITETFELIKNTDDTVSLKSKSNGKFVTIGQSDILRASADSIGNNEKFVFISHSAPDAPEGLKIETLTNSSATLSWQAVNNASGYNLYRSEDEKGVYTKVNASVITDTYYTDTGLVAGKTYYYKVTAVNNVGESPKSLVLPAAIPVGPTAPPAPANLSMVSSTETSVHIKWDSVSGASGYNVYRSISSSGTYEKVNTEPIESTSFADTGLSPASAYYYKITSVNDIGESEKSLSIFATTTGFGKEGSKQYSYIIAAYNSKIIETHETDRMVPLKAAANEVSSDRQLFEIIHKADGNAGIASKKLNTLACADSYFVSDYQLIPRTDYNNNPGGWEQFTIIPQGDGTVAIKANNGGKYVRVDPSTGILKADKSTTVGIYEKFIIVTPYAPEKPSGLNAADILDTSVTLTWQAPKNCVLTGYNIYRAVSGGNFEKINDTPVTELSYTDTGLTSNTQYIYKVVAVNIRGESEGAEISVATLSGPIPEKPEGIDLTIHSDGSATLTWQLDETAKGYYIYRASGRFGNYQKVNLSPVEGTSFTVDDTNAYKFYYRITAVNENGESKLSDPVSRDIKLFGPNVFIFDPSDAAAEIQNIADSVYEEMQSADTAQFASGRYALLFKPGTYSTDIKVGYYTHVAGLGRVPNETTIRSLRSEAALPDNNSTCNFWRSAENLTVNSNTQWAVSQAVSLRRVKINGNLTLHQAGGWASGGFLADSYITGTTESGSQQQWFSRNTYWDRWSGGVWNMVFVGIADGKAPLGTWPDTKFTTVAETPVIKEKPFLYIDENGEYFVFVPDLRIDSKGLSWTESYMGSGTSIPIDQFYIAHYDVDTADTINNALESGKHLILTPGIYNLDKPIQVNNENTVVLGLGLATLTAANGNACMKIADVGGAMIAGVLFDAGEEKSEVLLEVGPEGSKADHSDNPVVLSDLYFRVGGRNEYTGKADVCIIVNSNNVIGDNFWVWRADHGYNIKWDTNVTTNGIIVNGDNVTMYALMVEHFHEYQTLWNGNGGRTYFYQSEIPYDVPNQESWMSHNGTKNGYASYKVADHVTSHEAWGLGIYSYHRDATVDLHSAVEVPDHPNVKIHNACTVMLAGNPGISHVVNNEGGAVTKAGERQEVIYYCNNGRKVAEPVLSPNPGTYAMPQTVSIFCETTDAVIRYTLDGSEPTEDSEEFTAPITVDTRTVIKVRAFKKGLEPSDVVIAAYDIDGTGPDRSLVVNGTFETGNTDVWPFMALDGAYGEFSIENGMAKISMTYDGPNNWNIMLMQDGLRLEAGKTYVLNFDISSTKARSVDVCVENSSNNTIKYLKTTTVNTGPGVVTYAFEFESASEPVTGKLVFLLGGSQAESHDIFIDNVYLWEKDMSSPDQVKTPVFNIPSGTYFNPQEIQISCSTEGADIYYTLDGTEPSRYNGIQYKEPFVVYEDTVIKAMAVKEGMEDSLISSITLKFTDNFALNKPAKASSGNAALAFDGNPNSRWESEFSDPQWLMVDLGSTVDISGVKIVWEGAAGKVYDIKISDDAVAWNDTEHPSWNTAHSVTNGTGGHTLEVYFPPKAGRYVMVYGTERATTYGYSIWEFEIYANKVAAPVIYVDHSNPTAKTVTAICDTQGAVIRYTLDGSEPTNASDEYTEAITITNTTTVKFRAFKDGMSPSKVVTETVVIRVGNPVISYTPADLTAEEKTVTIAVPSLDDAEIWYTTDGTDPVPGLCELYLGPFVVTETTTIKAIACKTGMDDSDIVSILVKFNDNIALEKTAEASSVNGANTASLAVDGNPGTRWESVHNVDPQWITVDLGANYSIRKIRIVWEPACAKNYTIDISEDNENWTTIITKTNMQSPHTMDEILKEPVIARYVRMHGTERAIGWGYSIFEFEIYGTPIEP